MREVKTRFFRHKAEIGGCLNLEELVPLLCEGTAALLSFQEGQSLLDSSLSSRARADALFGKMAEKGPKSYSTFLSCVGRERSHLGHSYVQALLEGRQYASESNIALSASLKQAVVDNFSAFSRGICLTELTPHMYQRGLLTEQEREYVSNTGCTTSKRVMFLFSALDAKGPTAYSLFAECLRDEHSHTTHRELLETVLENSQVKTPRAGKRKSFSLEASGSNSLEVSLCKRPPRRLSLNGVLRSSKYRDLMFTFETYHHSGEWGKLEEEALKYVRDGSPHELQAVALLEMAVSRILRKDKDGAMALVSRAKETFHHLSGENLVILQGRCEYILSRLFRYLNLHQEAREHAENAKKILFNVEPGGDSAFANYCDGCALVETLGPHPTQEELERAECFFMIAIDDARSCSTGINLVAPHSFMRLAQMYLGSTHYTPGSVRDEQSISKATNCLKNVDPTSLSSRSRCYFLLIESDLYQSKGMFPEAERSATHALDMSRRCEFNIETISAENRLRALQII